MAIKDWNGFKKNGDSYIPNDDTSRTRIGTLSSLLTTAKDNLVAAINELVTSISTINGKIPSGASSSNKMATASDVATVTNGVIANTKLIKDTVGWSGKNKLPITLEQLKADNTVGTWSGNVYTYQGTTYTVRTDGNGYVEDITVNSSNVTASHNFSLIQKAQLEYLLNYIGEDFILNGCPSGGSDTTYRLSEISIHGIDGTTLSDYGEGKQFTVGDFSSFETDAYIVIRAFQGANISNKVFKPMLRDANILDDTYEPYHKDVVDTLREAEVIKGKNLFNPSMTSKVENGITWTVNDDKSIKGNGTTTADTATTIGEIYLEKGSYILSGNPTTASVCRLRLSLASNDSVVAWDDGQGATFTVDTPQKYALRFRYGNGVAFNNLVFKPMIRLATETDPTYEPYYIPLKDSMFPRSEQAVLGAKNFLYTDENTKTYEGVTYTVNRDNKGNITSVDVSGTPTAYTSIQFWADIKPNVYKISHMDNAANIVWGEITLFKNGVAVQDLPSLGTADDTIVDLRSYDFDKFKITAKRVTNGVNTTATIYPMLRLASDPDDTYVPHAMTNKELTEKKLEVFEINSAVDLNDITKTGMYIVKNTSTGNRPANTSNLFTLFVMSFGDTFCQQMAIESTGTLERIYTRRYGGSPLAWSTWYKVEGAAVS